jgi:hypothetical protein
MLASTVNTTCRRANFSPRKEIRSQSSKELIALHDRSRLIHKNSAVAIAIEPDPKIESLVAHGFLKEARSCGTGGVDSRALGFRAQKAHRSAEFLKNGGRHGRGGAVGAIDHDPKPRKPKIRGKGAEERKVVVLGLRPRPNFPKAQGIGIFFGVQRGFHRIFLGHGKLIPFGIVELEAVIFRRVVGSGDHKSKVEFFPREEVGDRRRGEDSRVEDGAALGGQARGSGRAQSRPGNPRIPRQKHPFSAEKPCPPPSPASARAPP